MTTQIAVKLIKQPTVKAALLPKFPANIAVAEFLTVARANGTFSFGVDYTLLDPTPIIDPSASIIAVYDQTSKSWKYGTLSALLDSTAQIVQDITAGGPVTVLNNAGIVQVNQTVGAAITLTLPLASAKTCPVLISDWKGDAGTHNITIETTGSDTFPGGLTTWTITADTGSVFLRPISGVGYIL